MATSWQQQEVMPCFVIVNVQTTGHKYYTHNKHPVYFLGTYDSRVASDFGLHLDVYTVVHTKLHRHVEIYVTQMLKDTQA